MTVKERTRAMARDYAHRYALEVHIKTNEKLSEEDLVILETRIRTGLLHFLSLATKLRAEGVVEGATATDTTVPNRTGLKKATRVGHQ